jgi:hypothetical protein
MSSFLIEDSKKINCLAFPIYLTNWWPLIAPYDNWANCERPAYFHGYGAEDLHKIDWNDLTENLPNCLMNFNQNEIQLMAELGHHFLEVNEVVMKSEVYYWEAFVVVGCDEKCSDLLAEIYFLQMVIRKNFLKVDRYCVHWIPNLLQTN